MMSWWPGSVGFTKGSLAIPGERGHLDNVRCLEYAVFIVKMSRSVAIARYYAR